MSNWKRTDGIPANVWLFPDAEADLLALDRGRQIQAIKAIQKIAMDPTHIGKPLGSRQGKDLSGFRSVYLDRKSIRVVWKVTEDGAIQVAVVAAILEREGMRVYETAARRRVELDAWIGSTVKNPQRES